MTSFLALLNLIRMIKSRRMRGGRHGAHNWEMKKFIQNCGWEISGNGTVWTT
jgi:hypothetical protein